MTATLASATPALKATPNDSRPFEAVWAELERRHAWRIALTEYHNPEIEAPSFPYVWSDYDNRRAAAFRERHRLNELLAGVHDDWEAVLRLRHWIFTTLSNGAGHGNPSFVSHDPAAIVASALDGATHNCTYYALAFAGAAQAAGLPARKLAIDSEHGPAEASQHHGVADVWVNRFAKWVVIDANYDHHYELDGVPLSAEEIGKRWQTHRGAGVQAFAGPERRPLERARGGKHEACAHFWHFIHLRNDFFAQKTERNGSQVVLPLDDARRAATWYQGKPPHTHEHSKYAAGEFFATERLADAYPALNRTHLLLEPPSKMPCFARVRFGPSCVPNFSHHLAQVNGREARIDGVEYAWRLFPGKNRLEVQAINAAGWRGPASRIEVDIAADPGRTPEWPAIRQQV